MQKVRPYVKSMPFALLIIIMFISLLFLSSLFFIYLLIFFFFFGTGCCLIGRRLLYGNICGTFFESQTDVKTDELIRRIIIITISISETLNNISESSESTEYPT